MKRMSQMTEAFLAVIVLLLTFTAGDAVSRVCIQAPAELVSWWSGDGDATDIADANDGTLQGGATFAQGLVGQAFSLDGVNGLVSVGNPANLQLSGGDFTVDSWVNFTSLVSPSFSASGPCFGPGCDMSIVGKMVATDVAGGPNFDGWRLLKQSDDHLWFCLGMAGNGCFDGSPTTVRSSTVVVPGVWYHVAGVKSSTGISIYVNGVLEESKPAAPFVDTDSADLLIGFYPQESLMYGLIDEVEIYSRALSTAEIQAVFNAGSTGKCKVTAVEIDVKPGSFPNSINPQGKGVIPVAILTTGTFDATGVNSTTVRFGATGTEAAPVQSALEDVDGDGDTDVILHFNTQDTGVECGDPSASLTGETLSGQPIEGSDSISMVGCQ